MRKAISVGSVLLAAVLISIMASARGADAATALLKVFVTNDTANPVPTKAVGTTPVSGSVSVSNFSSSSPPPLWQGTPYVQSHVDLHIGIENCQEFAIPAGKVLLLERAVVEMSTATGGSGGATVRMTPLDGAPFAQVVVPTHPAAPILQFDGNHPGYSGSVDIGIPVTAVSSCTRGADVNSLFTVIGYLVPAN